MTILQRLFRKPSTSDAARTLGAEAHRQHRDKVWANVAAMRADLGLPPVRRAR